ncbi:MAG: sigma-54 factor interaction domain-containing protein [Bacteriovoracaceae bacterium]|nr:sigma-54 factor interaction domain-containing protein [Bacteriovoracaceae bacterium]
MKKELCFMSDLLDEKGICIGDRLIIKPFFGRSQFVDLNRTQIDFTVKTKDQNSTACLKYLDQIQKEDFYFRLELVETKGRNGKLFKRYMITSLCSIPFKLNDSFVFESFVEHGDICEFGYHKIQFEKKSLIAMAEDFFPDKLNDKKLLESNIPILLEGKTGTGKTYLAKKIHELSGVKGEFVHVNLCAFAGNLIESELFGHVKGAFTGAVNDKRGALRQSHGGTLFLDEIDSLDKSLQTKLLLFLEDYLVRPVGSQCSYKVKTRLIFASGRNLNLMVKEECMRMDFFYRISSGFSLKLKCLSEDKTKLKEIMNIFESKNNVFIDQKLKDFYFNYSWPGNIRQFLGHLNKKKTLSRSMRLSYNEVDEALLEHYIESKNKEILSLKEFKNNYIYKAYLTCDKNMSLASKKLRISTKSLKRVLDEINLKYEN